MSTRSLLISQLIGTLLILALIPGNLNKLFAFVLLWSFTFQKISRNEVLFFVIICCFFTIMNALSLKQGIFTFQNPDILGMPYYELIMWGFYLLHTLRLIKGDSPQSNNTYIWVLAICFAASFGAIPNQMILFIVTMSLLGIGLFLYHDKLDLIYTLYMIALGAAIEYTGVWSGEWYYPGDPLGGVPPWFISLWGGVGFFLRRLAFPLIYPLPKKINHT